MPKNCAINYVEFPAKDLSAVKEFYTNVFGWSFTDFGPTYTAFTESGLDGGFTTDAEMGKGALIVLYHDNLEMIRDSIKEHGGDTVKDIFSFPGGKRFHFTDPSGNELAVWSDAK